MLTGLYVPGDSVLHRLRPGVKLVAMLVVSVLLVVAPADVAPVTTAVVAVLTVTAYLAAFRRCGPGHLWRQLLPLKWFVLVLVPFQVWSLGWVPGLTVVGTLVVAVAVASLVTLTTPLTDMLDTIVGASRPLRRFGVDPDRLGLLFALTLRALPVIATLVDETREARAARGQERSVRALATPAVIRTVAYAGRMGEALAARGLDD